MAAQLNLVCPEREYLEKVFIDFLRKQHPTLDLFRAFADQTFQQYDYQVYDATQEWPRDIRTCLLDQLTLSDVVRLSRTCKHWSAVILSPTYDTYWRKRHIAHFPYFAPTGPVPTEITVSVKRKKEKRTFVWFHVYQYVCSHNTRPKSTAALGRRTLRTFIEQKLSVSLLESTDLPNIYLRSFAPANTKYAKHFFPEWAVKILSDIRFPESIPDRISSEELASAILQDIVRNPQNYLTYSHLPFVKEPYNRDPDQWQIQVPAEAINKDAFYTVFCHQALRDAAKQAWGGMHKIYQKYFSSTNLGYVISDCLSLKGDTAIKAAWEIAGFII